jgi:hypothetical protein
MSRDDGPAVVRGPADASELFDERGGLRGGVEAALASLRAVDAEDRTDG